MKDISENAKPIDSIYLILFFLFYNNKKNKEEGKKTLCYLRSEEIWRDIDGPRSKVKISIKPN